jgi:hypothetical protein
MSYVLTRWVSSAAFVLLVSAVPAAAQPRVEVKRERPAALVPLYLTFAGLQAVDVHSTLHAIDNGAREANPMVRTALGHPTGMFLLKSGTAAGVVLLTERLWPRNRVAAVATMIALNSAYATIAAHNYRAAARH